MDSSKAQSVSEHVTSLYKSSTTSLGSWMGEYHVPWVTQKAIELAKKYQANKELVEVAAHLHDLADAWLERNDSNFDKEGRTKAEEILKLAQFTDEESAQVLNQIIAPHSCYPDNLPQILEGKVLATADALFHVQTDFYLQCCWLHHPQDKDLDQWREWGLAKLERDFHQKIFFEDERELARENYEAIKRILKIA